MFQQLLEDIRSKLYRGMEIDPELDEGMLDQLNSIKGITVKSVCFGHPEGTRSSMKAGDSSYAGIAFTDTTSKDPTVVYDKWRDLPGDVNVFAWGGPHGNWVVWKNGEHRNSDIFPSDPSSYPIDRVSISVDANFKTSEQNVEEVKNWFNQLIQAMDYKQKM
jgi:hypothetical protein